MKKARNRSTSKASRIRESFACEPAERDRDREKYDFSVSYREPKAAHGFLKAAESAAVRREERRQERQRILVCAALLLAAAGLLAVSAYAPAEIGDPGEVQAAAALNAVSPVEMLSADETGRKDWCYTVLILQRDESAETLEAVALGMLDRQEKTVSFVTVPTELLIGISGKETLSSVYKSSGAIGVKNALTGLFGYSVDHYVSLSGETAADARKLLEGGTVYALSEGITQDDWARVLEDVHALGYIRNRDGVISLLSEKAVTTLTAGNLRWYAGEILKLGAGSAAFYLLPVSETDGGLAVRTEEWLALLNEVMNPYCETITKENIRVRETA